MDPDPYLDPDPYWPPTSSSESGPGSVKMNTDPQPCPGGHLITDPDPDTPAGHSLVAIEKIGYQIGSKSFKIY